MEVYGETLVRLKGRKYPFHWLWVLLVQWNSSSVSFTMSDLNFWLDCHLECEDRRYGITKGKIRYDRSELLKPLILTTLKVFVIAKILWIVHTSVKSETTEGS